jgi:hypothetical protein
MVQMQVSMLDQAEEDALKESSIKWINEKDIQFKI